MESLSISDMKDSRIHDQNGYPCLAILQKSAVAVLRVVLFVPKCDSNGSDEEGFFYLLLTSRDVYAAIGV